MENAKYWKTFIDKFNDEIRGNTVLTNYFGEMRVRRIEKCYIDLNFKQNNTSFCFQCTR